MNRQPCSASEWIFPGVTELRSPQMDVSAVRGRNPSALTPLPFHWNIPGPAHQQEGQIPGQGASSAGHFPTCHVYEVIDSTAQKKDLEMKY